MRRLAALALTALLPLAAAAQTAPAPGAARARPARKGKAKPAAPAPAQTPPAEPAAAGATAPASGTAESTGQEGANQAGASTATTPGAATEARPAGAALDPEEFRRQVLEEVRRELAKMKEDVKREKDWVAQDSQARVQDSEAVDQLKQRVNLFQPHGYLRLRGEYFNNFDLSRGSDPAGYKLFPSPYIGDKPTLGAPIPGENGNHTQSDANFRFRFEPSFDVSEDLSIHGQMDVLDNIVLGSDAKADPYLDPFTPLSVLSTSRAPSTVRVKRLWGRVNTPLGEFLFGRMGYHWGLGILHNDGNCLDCDFGDTYDRLAFSPREIKGHHFSLMFDLLSKGATTAGEYGELGRQVALDTLVDGYRLGLSVSRIDTPDDARRKLDNNEWVINYGAVVDYRTQAWDTLVTPQVDTLPGLAAARANVSPRGAKIYEPDVFLSLRKRKFRLDAEVAMRGGKIATRQTTDTGDIAPDPLTLHPLTLFQLGGALQSDLAFLTQDALLVGVELGMASGDKGAYGFGARPWRSGSGDVQSNQRTGQAYQTTGPGDIDGARISDSHARVNNFVFNRAFNVDTILFRNLISGITSSWYLKPSIRYRPSGRKTGGATDESGFELIGSLMYAQAWYQENTPGLAKPLGLEFNVGVTFDTADHLHTGLTYGLLLPFSGLGEAIPNTPLRRDPSIAHAARFIVAIPF